MVGPQPKRMFTKVPNMGTPGPKAVRGVIKANQPIGIVSPQEGAPELIPATGQPKSWVTEGGGKDFGNSEQIDSADSAAEESNE